MKLSPSLSYRSTNEPQSLKPRIWVEPLPFFVLAILAVIGRYASRRIRRAVLGADDYMCLVALVEHWILWLLGVRATLIDRLDLHNGNLCGCHHW